MLLTPVHSQTLSHASATRRYCFASLPRCGPTLHSSTMWTSCAGTPPRPPSPLSRDDWTRLSLAAAGHLHADPRPGLVPYRDSILANTERNRASQGKSALTSIAIRSTAGIRRDPAEVSGSVG